MAGYGHDLEPAFIDAPTLPGWRQANPRAVLRLFADPRSAGRVDRDRLLPGRQAARRIRVVVQGESSAAGFPYGLGAALAGVLEQRLRRAWPEREIEVIRPPWLPSIRMRCSTSPTRSSPSSRMPSSFYVGHNEYLGILGVGSTLRVAGSWWITRAVLAAREWRLFQLARAIAGPARTGRALPANADDSLMARVAGERSIPLDSAAYRPDWRSSSAISMRCCPATSVPGYPCSSARWLRTNGTSRPSPATRHARPSRAGGCLDTAPAAEARRWFLDAKDLDELRFRAPGEAFNGVIREVAARRGAVVVEAQQRLVRASGQGIIGADLMLEHVHPNLDGYFLLADAASTWGWWDSGLAGAPQVSLPEDQARREMPVSELDRWFGAYKIARIRASVAVPGGQDRAGAAGARQRGRASRPAAVCGADRLAHARRTSCAGTIARWATWQASRTSRRSWRTRFQQVPGFSSSAPRR